MKTILLNVLIALAITFTVGTAHSIEEPNYVVVRQYQGFEVREYAPYLVAEVSVPGPASEAGNQGFKLLAAYIFGKNKGDRKIDMTAPVTQTAEPREIAMTAPVTQIGDGVGFIVQFSMPKEFNLSTIPDPIDPSVRLREEPGGRFAVIQYSGTWSESNYTEHLTKLREAVSAANVSTRGEPIYARYNAPFVPWFMRRNEIWLRAD
ncbi:MAG: heme-binding protein [Rhodocyclaceae bacterium]|nr:heme-binding protein [Rhodocyclaceae bacterium]